MFRIIHIMALIVEVAGKFLGLLGTICQIKDGLDNYRFKISPYSKVYELFDNSKMLREIAWFIESEKEG